jgi:hypothetical protein
MTPTPSDLLAGATRWRNLAKRARAWAEHEGSQGRDTRAHERKAALYDRTADGLEARARE